MSNHFFSKVLFHPCNSITYCEGISTFSKMVGQGEKNAVTSNEMVSYVSHEVVGQAWDKMGQDLSVPPVVAGGFLNHPDY